MSQLSRSSCWTLESLDPVTQPKNQETQIPNHTDLKCNPKKIWLPLEGLWKGITSSRARENSYSSYKSVPRSKRLSESQTSPSSSSPKFVTLQTTILIMTLEVAVLILNSCPAGVQVSFIQLVFIIHALHVQSSLSDPGQMYSLSLTNYVIVSKSLKVPNCTRHTMETQKYQFLLPILSISSPTKLG